jgi:hypothetical protein
MTYRTLNISGLLLPALIFCAVNLHSQEATTKPMPPSPPFIQKAPSPGQWTITFSYPEEHQPKAAGAPTAPPPDLSGRIRTITVTKVKDIAHVEAIRIEDTKLEEWHSGTTVYAKTNGTDIYAQGSETSEGNSSMSTSSEFQDMKWVTAESYLGTIKYSGHDCLVFVPNAPATLKISDADAFTKFVATAPLVAFIDAETRYPVEVRTGGVYHSYQFSDPPNSLSLPTDLVAQIKEGKRQADLEHQRAPRPY